MKAEERAYLERRRTQLEHELDQADTEVSRCEYRRSREHEDYYDRLDAHEDWGYAMLQRQAIQDELRSVNRRLRRG